MDESVPLDEVLATPLPPVFTDSARHRMCAGDDRCDEQGETAADSGTVRRSGGGPSTAAVADEPTAAAGESSSATDDVRFAVAAAEMKAERELRRRITAEREMASLRAELAMIRHQMESNRV